MIHIAITPYDLSDTYNRHYGAVLASIFENTQSQITIHILHNEDLVSHTNFQAAKQNKEYYEVLCGKYGAIVLFHHVSVPDDIAVGGIHNWNIGALSRLYLPGMLNEIDKIIYLDGDIIVNTDIKNLWNLDITNHPLAACIDKTNSPFSESRSKVTFDDKPYIRSERYFNSGVLYLNLDKIRIAYPKYFEFNEFLIKNPPCPDQDYLNYHFQDTYYVLDEKYNVMPSLTSSFDESDCILHYKPWELIRDKHEDYLYWKYLSLSPWGNEGGMLAKYVSSVPNVTEDSINKLSEVISPQQLIYFLKKVTINGFKRLLRYCRL